MSEQEKKWGEEAKEYFNKLDDPCNQGSYFYYVEGYLQACKVRQENSNKEIERLVGEIKRLMIVHTVYEE